MDCDPKLNPGLLSSVPLAMVPKETGDAISALLRDSPSLSALALFARAYPVFQPFPLLGSTLLPAPRAHSFCHLPHSRSAASPVPSHSCLTVAGVSVWAPELPSWDYSSIIMWLIATGTVLLGGLLAKHDWRVEEAARAGEAKARGESIRALLLPAFGAPPLSK